MSTCYTVDFANNRLMSYMYFVSSSIVVVGSNGRGINNTRLCYSNEVFFNVLTNVL